MIIDVRPYRLQLCYRNDFAEKYPEFTDEEYDVVMGGNAKRIYLL